MSILANRYPATTIPIGGSVLPPRTKQFEFSSVGPNGKFDLAARFSVNRYDPDKVDFGFGVIKGLDEIGGCIIDDKIRINNGDKDKIFNTVADLTLQYLLRNPSKAVFFQGSTPERTREYQMNIARNFDVLNGYVDIYGIPNNSSTAVPFVPNTVNYDVFIIILK